MCWHSCSSCWVANLLAKHLRAATKFSDGWSIFGSKYGPQNGVQNWITFSFLLLGLCLGPFLGSRFGPKSGASHRKILLLPADVLQADLRRTSMSVSVNTCFFSLCVPICFLYSTEPSVLDSMIMRHEVPYLDGVLVMQYQFRIPDGYNGFIRQ